MTAPALLFIGYGNPSRGDDALAPRLIDALEAGARPGLTLLTDFQLQVEHALDLVGQDLVLFIDATTSQEAACTLRPLAPCDDFLHTSHALAPAAVLSVYQRIQGNTPPPAFVLALRGSQFELGDPLSPMAEASLAAGLDLVHRLLATPSHAAWTALAAAGDAPVTRASPLV